LIDPESFTTFLEKNFQFITGVPCSYFKEVLIYLSENEDKISLKHVLATREDEAVGIASGVVFSGKRALVYMQNSGFANIGDALTSLTELYKLPMLFLISYRGLESDRGFPEHSIMGEVTEPILKAYNIPYLNLTEENWKEDMTKAIEMMEEKSSAVAVLIKSGVLSQ